MIPRLLNGRANPTKIAQIESKFDSGDILEFTGNWSKDYQWVEVYGGETGTVWVHIDYVSEVTKPYTVKNYDYKEVKIRSSPVKGKVKGYLKKGKTLEITQVIDNWGRCSKGWIDLSYLEEFEGDV